MKSSVIGIFCLLSGLATGAAHANEPAPSVVLVDTGASQCGLQFEQLVGQPLLASKSGNMLLILSPHEQALFLEGKLVRYMCIEGEDRQCRAQTSPAASPTFSFSIFAGNNWQGMGLRILDAEFFAARPTLKTPSSPYSLTHVDGKPYVVRYDALDHTYTISDGKAS